MIVTFHTHTKVTTHVVAFTVATLGLLELYVTAHGEFVVNVCVCVPTVMFLVTLVPKFIVGFTTGITFSNVSIAHWTKEIALSTSAWVAFAFTKTVCADVIVWDNLVNDSGVYFPAQVLNNCCASCNLVVKIETFAFSCKFSTAFCSFTITSSISTCVAAVLSLSVIATFKTEKNAAQLVGV